MTHEKFFESVQGLYGAYNEYQRAPVKAWILKRSQDQLTAIYIELVNTWETKFKAIPFIPDFDQAEERVRERKEREFNNQIRAQDAKLLEGPPNQEVDFHKLLGEIMQGPEAGKRFFGGVV